MTESTIERITFTDNEIKQANKRKSLAPQGEKMRIPFLVTDAQTKVADKGSYMIVCTLAPLKDPDDASSKGSPTTRNNLILPKQNKNHEGHVRPNTLKMCNDFLSAAEPEKVPSYPRRQSDGSYVYRGEEIAKDEYDVSAHDAGKATGDFLSSLWDEPSQLIGVMVWAQPYENKGYVNLKNFSAELPDDCEMVDPSSWSSEPEDEDEESEEAETETEEEVEEEKPAAKKGTSKPAAAPASKKTATKGKKK